METEPNRNFSNAMYSHSNQQGQRLAHAMSINPFSNREIEIIQLLSKGFTTVEIAGFLFISSETVCTHRRNMLAKWNCRNCTELVARCIKKGFI